MVDLFDPPQRAAFRERVVALRASGVTEQDAARRLSLTVTATQRAMSPHCLMAVAGVTDPYRLLSNPPDGDSRLRRHTHPRYQFHPRDGYPAWPDSSAE